MISASRLGRPPVIRTGASVLSDGRWWRAAKHALDGASPLAVLSPASGRSMLNGRTVNDNALVNRQGGIKYVVGADGVLSATPANTLAYDWSNGVRELLFEGKATNYAKGSGNSGAVVGVVGAGGAVPTGWVIGSGYAGLTVSLTGIGSTNGVPWAEFRIHGTNTGGTTVYPDPTIGAKPTAAVGQTWTYSLWASLVSGTWPPNKGRVGIAEELSGGGYLTHGEATTPISAWGRYSFTRTLTDANVGQIRPYVSVDIVPGATVDVTFRLGGLQIEQGSVATSYIPTSGAAVTRLADVAPLWSGAGDATAWAWRGVVPMTMPFQGILWASGGCYIESGGTDPTKLRFAGSSTPMGGNTEVLPGTVGICIGWGALGRVMCNAGKSPQSINTLVDRDRASMAIGSYATGLANRQVLRLRELVAWQLPDRPSAAGCQSQARLWSA